MTNFADARENMVESQVRPNGITDRRIIDAMAEIAREDFVPADRRAVAYMDEDVLLTKDGGPRYLVEAMAFARLVHLAAIKGTDRILHVGAATGYGSAVLARLGASVVALESDRFLALTARANLRGVSNITVVEGDLADGAKSAGPFDVVVIEGRVGEVPQSLIAQVAEGGRIVAVVGQADVAKAHLYTIHGKTCTFRTAFDASIAPLPGFHKKLAAFVF